MRSFQPPVITAELEDLPEVAGLAAAYEWDSPVAAWLVPDVSARPSVLMAWYTVMAEHALIHGYVDMTADRRSAAIWLDCTRPRRAPAHFLRRLTSTCGRHSIALLSHEHLITQHQPRAGHLRLVALAASAEAATTLLSYRHRHLEQRSIPAYATASSPAQCGVLTAAGYLLAPPCRLPGGPDVWPLRWVPGAGTPAVAAATNKAGRSAPSR